MEQRFQNNCVLILKTIFKNNFVKHPHFLLKKGPGGQNMHYIKKKQSFENIILENARNVRFSAVEA